MKGEKEDKTRSYEGRKIEKGKSEGMKKQINRKKEIGNYTE